MLASLKPFLEPMFCLSKPNHIHKWLSQNIKQHLSLNDIRVIKSLSFIAIALPGNRSVDNAHSTSTHERTQCGKIFLKNL